MSWLVVENTTEATEEEKVLAKDKEICLLEQMAEKESRWQNAWTEEAKTMAKE